MRFKKPTLLVDEADLETTDYNDEPNEDIFANESILAAANKVFDFGKYKKEQAAKINELKQQHIDDELFVNESVLAAANKVFDFNRYKKEQASALDWYNKLEVENDVHQTETINYVDDLNLDDVKENKNAIIASKKITDKYKKLYRKRRNRQGPPTVAFEPNKQRRESTKSALIVERNISKKYKNLRYS